MDELIPIIVDDKTALDLQNWCYTHKKNCTRGPSHASEDNDTLNMGIMGSPCVDYSMWGQRLGYEGKSVPAFLTMTPSYTQPMNMCDVCCFLSAQLKP